MSMTQTKPYFLRAIYEWIVDNGCTPYVVVDAGFPSVEVPQEHVEEGKITLNLSPSATSRLHMNNESVEFSARFGGVARTIRFPVEAVMGIYARENGQGLVFSAVEEGDLDAEVVQDETSGPSPDPDAPAPAPIPTGKPRLRVVK